MDIFLGSPPHAGVNKAIITWPVRLLSAEMFELLKPGDWIANTDIGETALIVKLGADKDNYWFEVDPKEVGSWGLEFAGSPEVGGEFGHYSSKAAADEVCGPDDRYIGWRSDGFWGLVDPLVLPEPEDTNLPTTKYRLVYDREGRLVCVSHWLATLGSPDAERGLDIRESVDLTATQALKLRRLSLENGGDGLTKDSASVLEVQLKNPEFREELLRAVVSGKFDSGAIDG